MDGERLTDAVHAPPVTTEIHQHVAACNQHGEGRVEAEKLNTARGEKPRGVVNDSCNEIGERINNEKCVLDYDGRDREGGLKRGVTICKRQRERMTMQST